MDIQASVDAILTSGTDFAESFYRRLADDHPDIFAHFDGINLKHQMHMLSNSLLLSVHEHRLPNSSSEYYLRVLGTRHSQQGIEREAYSHWVKTMLASLEEFHGERWNAEVAKEWRAAIEAATKQMLIGYDQLYHA